jgi:hypothetical protein
MMITGAIRLIFQRLSPLFIFDRAFILSRLPTGGTGSLVPRCDDAPIPDRQSFLNPRRNFIYY